MSRDAPTCGQPCGGILQQMVRGRAQGTALVFGHGKFDGKALQSVTLTLEPKDGGGQQAEIDEERIFVWTNRKAWTSGDITEDVLPDLLLAVNDGPRPTRYRFATDGALD